MAETQRPNGWINTALVTVFTLLILPMGAYGLLKVSNHDQEIATLKAESKFRQETLNDIKVELQRLRQLNEEILQRLSKSTGRGE